MNSLDASLDNLLIQYRLSLEAANRSPKTFQGYSDILRRFFDFLKENGHINSVSDIGKEEVRVYTKSLQNATRWPHRTQNGEDQGKLSPVTVQDHVRTIKVFWGWLFDNGYIEKNILVKYLLPKVPKIILITLTIDQIKLFLKAIDNSTSVGVRNYCIILLTIDNGMRISEVVGIQIVDLDLTRCRVKITGKGQKERIVSFTKITRKELIKYIKHHRGNLCKFESPYLFPASDSDHVSIKSIQQSIKRIGQKTGSPEIKYYAHLFRHTFATMFLAKGGDVMVLKEILGHESIQTTQKYVHLLPEELQKQHWKYSPVEDLFKQ